MERSPYIDEQWACIGATPERTWPASMAVGGAMRGPGGALELPDRGPDRTRVRARSCGAFSGIHGRCYRALVVGAGAHRVVVRLRRIEDRACSA